MQLVEVSMRADDVFSYILALKRRINVTGCGSLDYSKAGICTLILGESSTICPIHDPDNLDINSTNYLLHIYLAYSN